MALWLRLLLYASLALNLVVAGVVAGALLRGGPPPRDARDVIAPYIRALDADQSRALRRAFRSAARDGARPGAFLAGYRDVLALLRAEPFDPEAVATALERQGDAAASRQALGRRVLVQHLSGLDPAARAAFADRLEAELENIGKRRSPPRD
ncbi:periplasmic heavy metal sensor [Thalassococcus sp. CAU 1522]|uniref:Periplasmic heavy metal sensor n=2 Tax=Thalassococcus arenae TaxID=2851652 RepID=A0ABS6N4M8_9RHOB|nr:periplasmic heavy metal sensor [Thalassococcus arenae]